VLPDANVYTINDNDGEMFAMQRAWGKSLVVVDKGTYHPGRHVDLGEPIPAPDEIGAIGIVQRTDVMLLAVDHTTLTRPTGAISTRRDWCPSGFAAMWSFGEAIRLAALAALDISPNEIKVGLQPQSLNNQDRTHRLFIADSLDNGAGYARHLAEAANVRKLVEEISVSLRDRFEAPGHARSCRQSCPDCLSSYDNRRLHAHLDWRLALDVAELAIEAPLTVGRWLDQVPTLLLRLGEAFADFDRLELGSLFGAKVRGRGRVAFFGHPLWNSDPNWYRPEQADAHAIAEDDYGASLVKAFDVRALITRPHDVWGWLMGS
jgi:DEAD/DEAH box helicase domain-containing protein